MSGAAVEGIREGKPRTVLFLSYLDEQGGRISFLHAFPDADAMDQHFEGADERAAAAYEFIEPRGWSSTGSRASRRWKACVRRRRSSACR